MKISEIVDKYTYRVGWSDEDQVHIARCSELPTLAAHGNSSVDALKELKMVVSATLKWMQEEGEDVPEALSMKEFKGKLTLRVPSDTHRRLATESIEQGVSINQLILSKL